MSLRRHAAKEKVECKVIASPNEEEMEQLCEIELNAHESPWTYDAIKACFADNTRCIGLYLKNELIGFSVISVIYDEAELYTIGIKKKYQGLGFGHKLLLTSLELSKKLGAANCYLEVRVSNEVAKYLYDYYGFVVTGTRKNYYSATSTRPAEDAYTMVCDLSSIDESACTLS